MNIGKYATRANEYLKAVSRNRKFRYGAPRYMTYIVTFACNAKCIMCDSWKISEKGDLKIDEIAGIFDQLPHMDGLRLTGGEPFVRKDMPEIYQLALDKLNPMFIHITSNGFLTKRIVKFIEERDKKVPLLLLLSIDGVKEKHNYIRGRDFAFDTVYDTLTQLAPRQKELNLKLMVNQTIVDPDGVQQYKNLRDLLKPHGVRNNVVMAYDASATYNAEGEEKMANSQIGQFTTFGDFNESHLRELLSEIEKDLGDFPRGDRIAKMYYLRGIRNRLLGDVAKPNPKCTALNAHLRIFPNGDIPTCQFNTKVVGNLREKTFDEIWYGEDNKKIAAMRKWVSKCPGCWAECEVLPNAIYTGDLAKEAIWPTKNHARPFDATADNSVTA